MIKWGPGLGSETGIYRLFSQIIVAGHHLVNQRLANSGLPSVCVCVCVCVCVSDGLRIVFLFYNSEKMERRLFCGMGK